MKKLSASIFTVLVIPLIFVSCQKSNQISVGKIKNGQELLFRKTVDGEWGIEIIGGSAPALNQKNPIEIELINNNEEIQTIPAAYQNLEENAAGVEASAKIITTNNAVINVTDQWSIEANVVTVKRTMDVVKESEGGFSSSINLNLSDNVKWKDVNYMVPAALYADPSHNGEWGLSGTKTFKEKRLLFREDGLPAPLITLSFNDGASIAIANPTPDGASTVKETRLTKEVMTDERFQFGSIGAWQKNNSPIQIGYQFPGSMTRYPFGPNASKGVKWYKRFHPLVKGVKHTYQVSFRFGSNESFRDATRESWRWAWSLLSPKVEPIDLEQMRTVLTDHLVNQSLTIDGRSNIPFAVATYDTNQVQWNRTMTVMGFVSKNLECADQLLRESERDNSERGKNMRKLGLSIINSFVKALNKIPLEATGYDIATGKPWTGEHQEWLACWLRNPSEGMRTLIKTYRREKEKGEIHEEWYNWVKEYVDWLIQQQREDGSFPRRFKGGSSEVIETAGTVSYAPVPLLVMISEETNDPKYLESAIKAAEYIWENWGKKGIYVGGTNDNPNITDKEAGMLSLEAFLSLYENTKDTKWLERAKAAADYTETWMWIWNLPMPIDAKDVNLHWKKGVPTIGLQGINARGVGGVDEYMDWSASSYAKLYKYTKDEHYLDVARILLLATKAMVALPGRLYDLKAAGFQQEHWGLGPGYRGRGKGGHRFWLPWISSNHLYSITSLEEFDKEIFDQLVSGN